MKNLVNLFGFKVNIKCENLKAVLMVYSLSFKLLNNSFKYFLQKILNVSAKLRKNPGSQIRNRDLFEWKLMKTKLKNMEKNFNKF